MVGREARPSSSAPDAATSLAMIAGDFDSKGEAPRFGAPAADLVVLGFAGPRVAASSASLAGDGARPARRRGGRDKRRRGARVRSTRRARWPRRADRGRAQAHRRRRARRPACPHCAGRRSRVPRRRRIRPCKARRRRSAPATSPRARRTRSSPSSARNRGRKDGGGGEAGVKGRGR